MKIHNKTKSELIKINIILVIFYILLLIIRKSIPDYNEDALCIETEIASRGINNALEIINRQTPEVTSETAGELSNLKFTIDVTLADIANNKFKGNTATDDGYSGIIEFKLSDSIENYGNTNIEIGNTYSVEAMPVIEVSESGLPLITVINFNIATVSDIENLEEIKKEISTFKRKIIEYESLSLEEIVNDANNSYSTWTQEEVAEYIKFIEEKGYTDKKDFKSYVCLRESIKDVYKE